MMIDASILLYSTLLLPMTKPCQGYRLRYFIMMQQKITENPVESTSVVTEPVSSLLTTYLTYLLPSNSVELSRSFFTAQVCL